jgi:hypothetical protein
MGQSGAMNELRRVTTEYIEEEDRLRLLGEIAPGQSLALWLTQRLARRAVPVLTRRLDQQADEPSTASQLVQSFAQEAAVQSLPPQPAVSAVPNQENRLVHTVDITWNGKDIRLTFKSRDHAAGLNLTIESLRQWLSIVHGQWVRAGWPVDIWPAWIVSTPADRSVTVKH